jgi:hypothetical protein
MPEVLPMTTQNPTAGRPTCISGDGKKEEGASPLTSTIPQSADFLLFRGHGRRYRWQAAYEDMGRAASAFGAGGMHCVSWFSLCRWHDGDEIMGDIISLGWEDGRHYTDTTRGSGGLCFILTDQDSERLGGVDGGRGFSSVHIALGARDFVSWRCRME